MSYIQHVWDPTRGGVSEVKLNQRIVATKGLLSVQRVGWLSALTPLPRPFYVSHEILHNIAHLHINLKLSKHQVRGVLHCWTRQRWFAKHCTNIGDNNWTRGVDVAQDESGASRRHTSETTIWLPLSGKPHAVINQPDDLKPNPDCTSWRCTYCTYFT